MILAIPLFNLSRFLYQFIMNWLGGRRQGLTERCQGLTCTDTFHQQLITPITYTADGTWKTRRFHWADILYKPVSLGNSKSGCNREFIGRLTTFKSINPTFLPLAAWPHSCLCVDTTLVVSFLGSLPMSLQQPLLNPSSVLVASLSPNYNWPFCLARDRRMLKPNTLP